MPLLDIDKRDRNNAFRLVFVQALSTLLMAATALLTGFGEASAVSLATGGAISTLGSCWFAFVAYRTSAKDGAKRILFSFYAGEVSKIFLVMVMFVVAFKEVAVLKESQNALLMFLGFFITQAMVLLAPYLFKRP